MYVGLNMHHGVWENCLTLALTAAQETRNCMRVELEQSQRVKVENVWKLKAFGRQGATGTVQ